MKHSKQKTVLAAGLESLLGKEPEEVKISRATSATRVSYNTSDKTKASAVDTKEGETRATFIVNVEQLAKLKAIAYWERARVKDVVADMLNKYVAAYEEEHGAIKTIEEV